MVPDASSNDGENDKTDDSPIDMFTFNWHHCTKMTGPEVAQKVASKTRT